MNNNQLKRTIYYKIKKKDEALIKKKAKFFYTFIINCVIYKKNI